MGSEGFGECSKEPDSDGSGDDKERPLKKARYAWQVKGKYHLKDRYNNINKDDNHSLTKTSGSKNNEDNSINNNIDCGRRCCIEALLARSELLMASDESSDEDISSMNMEKSISDEIPVTLVKNNQKNQDYYLMKWQAKQLAKGYLDNTINKVLESWMVSLPFDANDMVENCTNVMDDETNDEEVEDEGILMAIQSHGLQSGAQNWGESSTNHNKSGNSAMSFIGSQELAKSTMDNYQNAHSELLKNKYSHNEDLKYNENSNEFQNIELGDHTNFLNAAVSVAIQKKGLASQNCERI